MGVNNFDVELIGPRIRALRERCGISMRELAIRSQVSASFVSKIESGKASPTVVSLMKLLDAMDVGLHEFFAEETGNNPADVIVYQKSQMAISQDAEHAWHFAFPRHPDIKISLSYEEYQPHTKTRTKESHLRDMCGFVISGELTIEIPGKGKYLAKAGDAFYIPAGTTHIAANRGDELLRLVATQPTQP